MTAIKKIFAAAIAMSSVSACTGAPDTASSAVTTPAPIARVAIPPVNPSDLDSLIQRVVKEKRLVGLSVGVMQDGKVILAKGYGVRTIESNEPVTPSTMFAIGSVTKQFTCAAALLLEQDGKLSMQDKVSKYTPNATRGADITLLDLGQHVSGYRDYYPLDFVVREMAKPEPADTIIARYATRPLDFEPGSRWSYSNTNFLILGKAIEAASGKSFGAFIGERIFTPLGMTRSSYNPPASDTGMARGYTSYALAAPSAATPEGDGWAGAAGAIWSTPTDILAWDLALMDGKALNTGSYRALTTPRTLSDGRSTNYGCGLSVALGGDAVVYSHGGAVAGFVAQNQMVPATRSAVVVFSNADFAATGEIISAVMNKLVPHADVPKIAGLSALDAAKGYLASLEKGQLDRATLGDDFNALMTEQRVATDRASLAANGKVADVAILRAVERGGMEVAVVTYKVGAVAARSAMYRTPDGKIQQFLINRQ